MDPIMIGVAAVNLFSFIFGSAEAARAARLQREQIQSQRLSLELQKTAGDIQAMRKLDQVLNRQTVVMGARHLDAETGTALAITEQSLQNYIDDKEIRKLNYMGKEIALDGKELSVNQKETAQIIGLGVKAAGNIFGAQMDINKSLNAGVGNQTTGSLETGNLYNWNPTIGIGG